MTVDTNSSIAVSVEGWAVILVIMYVKTFKSDVIVFDFTLINNCHWFCLLITDNYQSVIIHSN